MEIREANECLSNQTGVKHNSYPVEWQNGFQLNEEKTMNTFLTGSIEGVLSRKEMKSILAGNTNCLICWNDDGADAQEIDYALTDEDPDLACRRNGPYSSGSWGQCSDLAIH